ncbi:MAG: DUF2460 domain-containing protein [bacterium]
MASYPTTPQPLKTYVKGMQYKTLVTEFEYAYEQRRKVWPTGKATFKLIYDVLNQAEQQILWDFYVARSGAYEAFEFTDYISSTTHTVRYAKDDLSIEEFQYQIYRLGIDLIEVL